MSGTKDNNESTLSCSASRRKEANKRYYESRKAKIAENNFVDLNSQNGGNLDPMNHTQGPGGTKNALCALQRKETNKRYYETRKAKRPANNATNIAIPESHPPIEDTIARFDLAETGCTLLQLKATEKDQCHWSSCAGITTTSQCPKHKPIDPNPKPTSSQKNRVPNTSIHIIEGNTVPPHSSYFCRDTISYHQRSLGRKQIHRFSPNRPTQKQPTVWPSLVPSSTVPPSPIHVYSMPQHMNKNSSTACEGTAVRTPMSSQTLCLDNTTTHITNDMNVDPYSYVFNTVPKSHLTLTNSRTCRHCQATLFQREFPTFCCMGGKTLLAHTPIPKLLYDLYTSQDTFGTLFRANIRAYNTSFSFASMGVSLDENLATMRDGIYTFCAHGGIYHKIHQLVPTDGTPRYLQLYFYDPDTELEYRLKWPNLDRHITSQIAISLSGNPYVVTFRSLGQVGPLDKYRVSLNASVNVDQRVYNKPTTSEVAGIWVEGNDNISTYKRSIVLHGKSTGAQYIQPYFGCYDPLAYPLFFPHGECGWHNNIPRRHSIVNQDCSIGRPHNVEDSVGAAASEEEDHTAEIEGSHTNVPRGTVAMREYYCYKFQIRPLANTILLGGRLLQQFVVDMYIKIETSRLHFCQFNQRRIRADLYQGIVDCVNAGDVRASNIGRRIVLPPSFIGGPRDMRRRFLDAMALVQEDGKPDFFITMTCNPTWPEITENLQPGQSAQDRPDLVSRIFLSKVEELKHQLLKKHILGEVKAYVYVIEFQKRGLPHAHFLIILHDRYKLHNPDNYDKYVCAEIPSKAKYPLLHAVVTKHMLHGPCGSLRKNSPCMEGEPPKCRFHYPRQFNEHTTQGEDAYPLYRRRADGVTVDARGASLDNRWVVPYNPTLLMLFNCHMNVEVCSSIKSVKYLFKYIYKGHDKQVIQVDGDREDVIINEIKRYQDARYVSPPEAMWRIFAFALSQMHPTVVTLQVHLPGNHTVTFNEDDRIEEIVAVERNRPTMLTAFFAKNNSDPRAHDFLYKDFPAHYTWNSRLRCWNDRTKNPQRGRVVTANPAEGERYYLRLLLTHVKGATSFEHLRTINGNECHTFRHAAQHLGLIEDDNVLSQCLTEAAMFQFPSALRRLFATVLTFCEPGNVMGLWTTHFESLAEDHIRYQANISHVQNMVLTEIGASLQSMGKSIQDFDLPKVSEFPTNLGTPREVVDEYNIVVDPSHVHAKHYLNDDQRAVFDEIMRYINEDIPGVFFIDGPGGTGKTFLYKALLAEVRSNGHIALATATSGAAANNMPGGRTAHSRFKIPITLNNNSLCSISKQSGTARLITCAKVVIWDEASMAKRQGIEAVDRTFQDLTGVRLPFGGKIMVMGGDFRQVLPVIKKGTRAQFVDASVRMSPIWSITRKLKLTKNMRALNDSWFADFLLKVGNGTEHTVRGDMIRIPTDMTIPFTTKEKSIDALIDAIFPSLQTNGLTAAYITSRAILTTRNESVDEINDNLITIFPGHEKHYHSFDSVVDDQNHIYPIEFLNSLNVSGLPPHKLRLKIGCPIILLRNIDPSAGLCNGTRLTCKAFQTNVIDAEISVGDHKGKLVFLPRITLTPSEDDMFPFKIKRKQFPVRLSFAMTINKAQGQTIERVGVYLPQPVFSHGQLYVALSRCTSRENTKVLVHPTKETPTCGVFTSNVVYREVLQD